MPIDLLMQQLKVRIIKLKPFSQDTILQEIENTMRQEFF